MTSNLAECSGFPENEPSISTCPDNSRISSWRRWKIAGLQAAGATRLPRFVKVASESIGSVWLEQRGPAGGAGDRPEFLRRRTRRRDQVTASSCQNACLTRRHCAFAETGSVVHRRCRPTTTSAPSLAARAFGHWSSIAPSAPRRMGVGDPLAAVDPEAEVHGLEGLLRGRRLDHAGTLDRRQHQCAPTNVAVGKGGGCIVQGEMCV